MMTNVTTAPKFMPMISQAYLTNGARVDVISPEQYWLNPNIYDTRTTFVRLSQFDQYILPIKITQFVDPSLPGYYINPTSPFIRIILPQTESDKDMYSSKNMVDYSNVQNIYDFLDKNEEAAQLERRMFLSDQLDDVIKLSIDDIHDSPLMIFTKRILNDKQISSKLLENRMGANYNNNMRLLKNKNDISYNKAVEILNCVDVQITATASNKSGKIINPLQNNISYKLN